MERIKRTSIRLTLSMEENKGKNSQVPYLAERGIQNNYLNLRFRREISLYPPSRDKNNEWQKPLVIFMAEREGRKLNLSSPTPDNLKFLEFNPPENKPFDKLEFGELIILFLSKHTHWFLTLPQTRI